MLWAAKELSLLQPNRSSLWWLNPLGLLHKLSQEKCSTHQLVLGCLVVPFQHLCVQVRAKEGLGRADIHAHGH